MKARREITTTRVKIVSSLSSRKYGSKEGEGGMKLVEENVRTHIHCDVVNCLREEGMDMQHMEMAVARYDYRVND